MRVFEALLLVLLLNAFTPAGVSSLVSFLLLIFVVLHGRHPFRVPLNLLKWSAIPLAILLIASVNAPGHDLFDILKDAWYMLYPVLSLAVGYMLCWDGEDLDGLISAFVVAGLLVSLAYIAVFVAHLDVLSKSVEDIREANGSGYFLSILVPLIVFLGRIVGLESSWLESHRMLTTMSVFACIVATLLSFSRSLWVSALLALAANLGVLRRRATIIAVCLLVLVVGILIFQFTSSDSGGIQQKIFKSVSETMIQDESDYSGINANWRGFEAFMALRTYLEGTPINYILGLGLGQLVDIGFYMPLGDVELRYLPILHNGYMYILVKSGVVGIILYVAYLFTIFKHGRQQTVSHDKRILFCGRLEVAMSLIVLATTLVITGIYNRSDLHPVMILLGICFAVTRQREKLLDITKAAAAS